MNRHDLLRNIYVATYVIGRAESASKRTKFEDLGSGSGILGQNQYWTHKRSLDGEFNREANTIT
jgi:hypothetical protein